jgi:hypothetical protein
LCNAHGVTSSQIVLRISGIFRDLVETIHQDE